MEAGLQASKRSTRGVHITGSHRDPLPPYRRLLGAAVTAHGMAPAAPRNRPLLCLSSPRIWLLVQGLFVRSFVRSIVRSFVCLFVCLFACLFHGTPAAFD